MSSLFGYYSEKMFGRTDIVPDTLPPMTIWIREQMRLGKAKSLRQIARYARISPDTVKNIYDGVVARPEPETITKLAKYFGVPRDDLMALAGYVERPALRQWFAQGAFQDLTDTEIEEARRIMDEELARRRHRS